MRFLLFPFKLIGFVILFALSLIFKLLGLFVTYVSTVFGVITRIIGIVMDLGAVMVTVIWLIGMEETTWNLVLATWILVICWNCAWILGSTLGEWISEKGDNIGDLAVSIFSSNNSMKNDYSNQTGGDAEEIYKYKKLLDEGVITQAEYNAKKKQILDIE